MSGFEEGYVALTRARHETRVYVVDGTVTHPNDLDHAPAEADHHGLTEITAALQRRTSGATVTELAPGIDQVAGLAARSSLAELTRERKYLDRILADAPPDPTHELAELDQQIDTLRTRRRALTGLAAESETPLAASPVNEIDTALTVHAAAYRTFAAERDAYDAWATRHAPVIEQRALVRRAEQSVEQQVRVGALADPNDPARRQLGDPPADQAARRAWRRAIGDAAIYRARYTPESSDRAERIEDAVLGRRPAHGPARKDWEHAATNLHRANTQSERVLPDAGVEL